MPDLLRIFDYGIVKEVKVRLGGFMLKELLGETLYEAQKEVFKGIIDGGKKELKKQADDIYILQKEVMKELIDKAKAQAKEEAIKRYDEAVIAIGKSIPYVGFLVVAVLKKYKNQIIEVIF